MAFQFKTILFFLFTSLIFTCNSCSKIPEISSNASGINEFWQKFEFEAPHLVQSRAIKLNNPELLMEKARELSVKAQAGDVESQYHYGVLCQMGIGVKQDTKQAFEWFQKAAKKDHPTSQFNLAQFYVTGLETEKNRNLGLEWAKKAATNGHTISLQFLTNANSRNQPDEVWGITPDKQQWEKWSQLYVKTLEKKALEGDKSSPFQLFTIYNGQMGFERDNANAFKWVKFGAENGIWVCQKYLAHTYKNGNLDIEKNIVEAQKWYKKAIEGMIKDAENGVPGACLLLGNAYEMGNGVEMNRDEAEKWKKKHFELIKAEAESGNSYSQYMLVIYYSGLMGKDHNDSIEAYKWSSIAMDWFSISSIVPEQIKELNESYKKSIPEDKLQEADIWVKDFLDKQRKKLFNLAG